MVAITLDGLLAELHHTSRITYEMHKIPESQSILFSHFQNCSIRLSGDINWHKAKFKWLLLPGALIYLGKISIEGTSPLHKRAFEAELLSKIYAKNYHMFHLEQLYSI
eukprot:2253130-Amphidinium_carterae.1